MRIKKPANQAGLSYVVVDELQYARCPVMIPVTIIIKVIVVQVCHFFLYDVLCEYRTGILDRKKNFIGGVLFRLNQCIFLKKYLMLFCSMTSSFSVLSNTLNCWRYVSPETFRNVPIFSNCTA